MRRPTIVALAAALCLGSTGAARGLPARSDWEAALRERQAQDVRTGLGAGMVASIRAQALEQLKKGAKAWIDTRFQDLPEATRSQALKTSLDVLVASRGDLDGAVRALLDGRSDDAMAGLGGAMASALQAGAKVIESSPGHLQDRAWQGARALGELTDPGKQIGRGFGFLAEGHYTQAGREFALAIPGVKKVHDAVKSAVEVQRKAFHALQDESYDEVYRRWKDADSTRDLTETRLLFDATTSKNVLELIMQRRGWKDREVALRRITHLFERRAAAEEAARAQYQADLHVVDVATKRGYFALPDELPPEGPARTRLLGAELERLKRTHRVVVQRLVARSGVPAARLPSGSLATLLRLHARLQQAIRRGDGKALANLRGEIAAEEARLAAELEAAPGEAVEPDSCDQVPDGRVQKIERRLLGTDPSKLVSLLTRVAGKEGRQGLLNCICRVHSGASVGVSTTFETRPVGGSDGCKDVSGGPCVSSSWGCWRTPLKADATAMAQCGAGRLVARALCQRGAR